MSYKMKSIRENGYPLSPSQLGDFVKMAASWEKFASIKIERADPLSVTIDVNFTEEVDSRELEMLMFKALRAVTLGVYPLNKPL